MNNKKLAQNIIEFVGGTENIDSATHCMTRLRFTLKNVEHADEENLKKLDGVVGVVFKGGQYQVIVGPEAASIYGFMNFDSTSEASPDIPKEKKKITIGSVINDVLNTLSSAMTPLIPILLSAGLAKTIVAVFGPQLLGWISETSNTYILFSFVGDAGFYFLPIFVAYTTAKRFGVNEIMALFLGAIIIHPEVIRLAESGVSFSVYGIPASLQNYTQSIIPIVLSVWVMSFVEGFFKKYTPSTLKIFGVPFGTLLVMLPLTFIVFGPMGAFLGNYIGKGIIGLYDIAGPLALGILGAVFALLVVGGMHHVIFAFLFVSFPTLGYDAFVIPAMIASSWAAAGVALACIYKFKNKEERALTIGYFLTWLLGGVGEPLLYGLNIPYKTPMYASIISGFISGMVAGLLGLKAYVLNPSNGIYGLASFFGGPNSNITILAITLIISTIAGFVTMLFFPLNERKSEVSK